MTYLKKYTLLGLLMVCLSTGTALAATIKIMNADGAGEGFNDPTVVAPVGDNPGTTLGAQRLKVFEYAAQIWGGLLDSSEVIWVEAQFDPLPCNALSAALGAVGPTTVHRDFIGAPMIETWYPQALANALAKVDLSKNNPDLGATFNSSIDNNNSCLNGTSWYLGLDGNNGGDIDLADVVVHEIGHGLGFASYVDESTGERFFNKIDIYSTNLEDHSLSLTWEFMTDTERQTSAIDTGDLHFIGNEVSMRNTEHVPMYAPNPVEQGSSVSHWDTSLTPNELMEPFITNPPSHDPGLAFELMLDIGWSAGQSNTLPDVTISLPAGNTFVAGDAVSLSGSASDVEDGNLSSSISWSSNLDGPLGTGASLSVVLSAVGDHTISASVTDSASGSASAQVLIEITPASSALPNAPGNVVASDLGNGGAHVIWMDNSDDESKDDGFSVWRDSPHKKRTGVFTGGTEVGTVMENVTSFDDMTAGAGTFRYCVRANNIAGSSDWSCSPTVVVTNGDTGGGGGGGGGDFCSAHPSHKRCQ